MFVHWKGTWPPRRQQHQRVVFYYSAKSLVESTAEAQIRTAFRRSGWPGWRRRLKVAPSSLSTHLIQARQYVEPPPQAGSTNVVVSYAFLEATQSK
jgi:hypothetical protein